MTGFVAWSVAVIDIKTVYISRYESISPSLTWAVDQLPAHMIKFAHSQPVSQQCIRAAVELAIQVHVSYKNTQTQLELNTNLIHMQLMQRRLSSMAIDKIIWSRRLRRRCSFHFSNHFRTRLSSHKVTDFSEELCYGRLIRKENIIIIIIIRSKL